MNVFMINSGYTGCCYVRVMLPAWHNGFNTDKNYLVNDKLDVPALREALASADIVVFHRPETEEYHNLADMLIRDGKKIVMDNDDTFKLDDVHPLAAWTPDAKYQDDLNRRDSNCDEFIKKADLVTTSTEFLAKEYRQISDKVLILPNCVDPMDWDETLRNETDKVRIGMVGSVSYEYDYHHIKPLLRKLGKRDDVELVLFGLGDAKHRKENPNVTKAFKDDYAFWDSIEKEQIPWCAIEDYPTKLNEARLDMMLIPRKDNYFNRCKSNIKVLEAAMCEIPCVCQSFEDGPYEEFKDGENVLLVRDNKKWENSVDFLIKNKGIRRQIGENAREYALKMYNIEDNAYKWADAYNNLI